MSEKKWMKNTLDTFRSGKMKIAQKIVGIFIFCVFFFLSEACPNPMHQTVRGHQKLMQIPRSIVISGKKVILAVVVLTTEKSQRRGYSHAVF